MLMPFFWGALAEKQSWSLVPASMVRGKLPLASRDATDLKAGASAQAREHILMHWRLSKTKPPMSTQSG